MAIMIPSDLLFPQVKRNPVTGGIEVEVAPLKVISAMNPDLDLKNEDAMRDLLVAWYHRANHFCSAMEDIRGRAPLEVLTGEKEIRFVPPSRQ